MSQPRFTNRQRVYGEYDAASRPLREHIFFVDGVEATEGCFYVNTETGVLKTFNVMHDGSIATTTAIYDPDSQHIRCKGTGVFPATQDDDGTIHFSGIIEPDRHWKPEDFPGREVECPPEGVLSETLRGEVEIWGPEI